ncbi:MAG TPA: TatD family hydrolase [Candidatus Paceibacterota bacterium]|nr:TatD family hydrolase [Candidatus Paceibacterota bacterium]
MKPKLIDVHTHVQFAAYDSDMTEVIDRSLKSDTWLINVGTQQDTSAKAVEVANLYKEGVYATIGLHPIHTEKSYHDSQELGGGETAKDFTSRGEIFDYEFYKKLGADPKVLAIGECGLDYYRLEESSRVKQLEAFESQIKLSFELKKPLMIHCRNAFRDLIDCLIKNKNKLNDLPGIIHFFTGTPEDAAELMKLGFYFSFGGVTTFTRDYDAAIKKIGLDRIVLETDAPYVTPIPFRGKRNEPSYLSNTAKAVSEILGVTEETAALKTTANAKKVLKINI